MSKYFSKRTAGRASKRESSRAEELALLQKIGAISELEEQPKFLLLPRQDGEREVTYTADFRYRPLRPDLVPAKYIAADGLVTEDSKGFKTQQYIVRRKMMLHFHGIRVYET